MFDDPQDELLVIVALIEFWREWRDVEPGTAEYALDMATWLAHRQGIDPHEAILEMKPVAFDPRETLE